MLTLKRFKALTDSYGADPGRWPEADRADAAALLRVSAEAQRVLAEARALDQAIDASTSRDDAMRWPPGEDDAALARLRACVAARLTDSPSHEAPVVREAPARAAADRAAADRAAADRAAADRAAADRATADRVAADRATADRVAPPRAAATGRATPPTEPARSPAAPEIAAPPPWLRWLRSHVSPVAHWSTPARVAGMAAAGGLIVAVGLLLGSMEVTTSTAQVDVLAMLQPNPLPFLADQ